MKASHILFGFLAMISFTVSFCAAGEKALILGINMEKYHASSSILDQLGATLSKMHPIEESRTVVEPTEQDRLAPRFCWKFFRPDPESYMHISAIIGNFKGKAHWILHSSGGLSCIAASRYGAGITFYAPAGAEQPYLETFKEDHSLTMEFLAAALDDVPALCEHIERALGLERAAAKSFDPALIAPADPPSPTRELVDFLEPGMHVVWVVSDPDEFARSVHRAQANNKLLHFSVTFDEYQAIYSELVAGQRSRPTKSVTWPRVSDLSEYPLILRIQAYESATFEPSEIEPLVQECLRVRVGTSKAIAHRGLDKLILMGYWARAMRSGLYLMGP